MSPEFVHEPDAHRYVLRSGDGTGDSSGAAIIAVVDYAVNDSAVSFTRTYTTPMQRGKGFAAQIVKFAVDDVEATGDKRIIPMCWYVADWFEANPERAGLLTR
jgi:predicted GNAT family acetyltransferase